MLTSFGLRECSPTPVVFIIVLSWYRAPRSRLRITKRQRPGLHDPLT